MLYYYIFAIIILLVQAGVMVEAWRHFIFTRRKYRPKPSTYHPSTALICPCKGIDTTFERNINSLFDQKYANYQIFLVVESRDDPAYHRLEQIIEQQKQKGNPVKTELIVAGLAGTSSQKVHNQLTAYRKVPGEIEVLAFIDSDACLKSHFLDSLIHPLRKKIVGASTGYRWYVPTDNKLPSRVLSAMNAFFASTFGPHPWNCVWGGAMAIKRDLFEKLDVPGMWQCSLSDDYIVSHAVKKAELEIAFVPSCFVASYEQTGWADLFSFARRQFLITRVYMVRVWYLAVMGVGHSVLGFWIGLGVTIYLLSVGSQQAIYASILPNTLYIFSVSKALMRQTMIAKILTEDREPLLVPALLDILLNPLVGLFTLICLFGSAGSRTITWRGKRYVMHSINHTEILPLNK